MKIDWLRFVPKYWFQNDPTDWAWDEALNALLDRHKVQENSSSTVKVGKAIIWVGNYPYAYGNLYEPTSVNVLPSVATRKRLRNAVRDAAIAEVMS